jgi:hypothetical protein
MDSVTVLPIRRSIPISVSIVTRWDFLFAILTDVDILRPHIGVELSYNDLGKFRGPTIVHADFDLKLLHHRDKRM